MKKATLLIGLMLTSIVCAGPEEDVYKAKAAAELTQIAVALQKYKQLAGMYPTTIQGLQALVERPKLQPIPRRWMKLLAKIPRDPWGRVYRYKVDEGKFSVWSTGPDEQDDDDDVHYKRTKTEQTSTQPPDPLRVEFSP